MTSSEPKYLPKALPPNTIPSVVKAATYGVWGYNVRHLGETVHNKTHLLNENI